MIGEWDQLVDDLLEVTIETFDKESVVFVPCQGSRFKVKAVFDKEFENLDVQTENVIASNQPALGIKLSDFPRPPTKKDVFIVDNIEYSIEDVQEDGQGGATVFLHLL